MTERKNRRGRPHNAYNALQGRPPEGTVRPWKVAQAKRKMFQLVDNPVAIVVVTDALLDELCPDKVPPQRKGLKLVP